MLGHFPCSFPQLPAIFSSGTFRGWGSIFVFDRNKWIFLPWDHFLNPQIFTTRYLDANKLHTYILYKPPAFSLIGTCQLIAPFHITGKSGNHTCSLSLFHSTLLHPSLSFLCQLNHSWQSCGSSLQKQQVDSSVPGGIIFLWPLFKP